MRRVAFVGIAGSFAVALACSSTSSTAILDPVPDGATGDETGTAPEGSTTDAPTNEGGGGTCEGACKQTSLVADFGGKTRTLARAQSGTQPGDGGVDFHVETHLGGDPACPTETSPSPEYTFVVTQVPRGRTGKLTEKDGPKSAFFDFKGDLALPPITRATKVEVTIVAQDTASPPAWVAMDVSATFAEGTVVGHLYASHCASLDQ